MLMFGEGRMAQSMPLGTTRPHLDENGKFLHTKQDLVWLPELDEDFKKFVKELCLDLITDKLDSYKEEASIEAKKRTGNSCLFVE